MLETIKTFVVAHKAVIIQKSVIVASAIAGLVVAAVVANAMKDEPEEVATNPAPATDETVPQRNSPRNMDEVRC